MTDISTEAKVAAAAFWGAMMTDELSFNRPHIIHPRMRKGLDDLVDAGYLTVEKFNDYSDKLVWKPTAKMKSEKPGQIDGDFCVTRTFLEKNSFPVTTE